MDSVDIDPHDSIPPPTHDRVDYFVQRWVAGTNGRLYIPLINKLTRYPIGKWPGRMAPKPGALLLDVGCGWGRWLVAAARHGYTPIGIDIKFEAAQAACRVMKYHNVKGYAVVADLKHLPFRSDSFDQVYSYSVLQHVHRDYAEQLVNECHRTLKASGEVLIEFPIEHGITNFRHGKHKEDGDPTSWCVRRYSFQELRKLFSQFSDVDFEIDCYFGIGVRPEDVDLLPWRYKVIVWASELMKALARILPPLRYLSDSVFVRGDVRAFDLER